MEEMGEEKLFFRLLKPVKGKKSQFKGKVSQLILSPIVVSLLVATEKLKLLLSLSAKKRRNPYSGPSPVYQDLNTRHDWPLSICQSG